MLCRCSAGVYFGVRCDGELRGRVRSVGLTGSGLGWSLNHSSGLQGAALRFINT